MIISSLGASRERVARLVREIEGRAFDSYLRHGRVPEVYAKVAKAARDERAFAEYCGSPLSLKALGEPRPTSFYTWRTMLDDRVRPTHAANEGRVFAWSDPPATGHPGRAPNCRCRAEPYYGNPSVPDAALLLRRTRRTDTSGRALWASIETLTRPDGSLAQSAISMRDGTRIDSTFAGPRVTHDVRLPDGQYVQVEQRDGVQLINFGDGRVPVLGSVWTATGPRLGVPRRRVAELLRGPNYESETIEIVDPLQFTRPDSEGIAGAIGQALIALYNAIRAEPESLGSSAVEVQTIAIKVWRTEPPASGIAVHSLTAQQLAECCKLLPQVQLWTDEAATELAMRRSSMSAQSWGTAVHARIKEKVVAFRLKKPRAYPEVHAEISLDDDGNTEGVSYGRPKSTRLDILEAVNDNLVCVYDVKTGLRGLSPKRIQRIAEIVAKWRPGAAFFIIEVRPFG